MASTVISCRWDWCRSSFPTLDALDAHVKHEHIWPMKPMRKSDIVSMRRMDLQSLHSSPHTDSSIFSREPTTRRKTTPPAVPPSSTSRGNDGPGAFARQDERSGLSAAAEMFERHGHKPSRLSSVHRPQSCSSGSSQEMIEQQLTQEDGLGSHPHPFSVLEMENELVDTELRWPTDDESNLLAPNAVQHSTSELRGVGGLSVSLPTSAEAPRSSEGSRSQSQPFVLQSQATYSSQAVGWSQ